MKNNILSLLLNSTNFLFCSIKREGQIIKANQLFNKSFFVYGGVGSFFNSIKWEESQQWIELKEEMKLDNFSYSSIELVFKNEINEKNWYSWEFTRIQEDDKISLIYCVGKDVTALKKQNYSISAYKQTVNYLNDAIISTDVNFKIQVWNKQAEYFFESTAKEMIGKSLDDIKQFESILNSLSLDLIKIKKFGFIETQIDLKLSSGKLFILNVKLFTNINLSDNIIGFTFIFNDCTSQIELSNKEKTLRAFLNNCTAMAWIVKENGTIAFMNSLAQQNFHLQENPIGKSLYDIMPEAQAEKYISDNRKILKRNKIEEREDEEITPDGRRIILHTIEFPIIYSGDEKMCAGLAFDITDIKKLQMKLVDDEKKKKIEIIEAISKAEEAEKADLYNQLHERIGQTLSSMKIHLQTIDTQNNNQKTIQHLNINLEKVIKEVQKISYSLQPSLLFDMGMKESINELIRQYTIVGRFEIEINLPDKIDTLSLNLSFKILLFEWIQEYLNYLHTQTNASKVLIKMNSSNSVIRIVISDNSTLNIEESCPNLKMQRLKDRIAFYNGTFTSNHSKLPLNSKELSFHLKKLKTSVLS